MEGIEFKQPNFGFFIGKAEDADVRKKATSGGIGTSVVKYLLSTEGYDTALTFRFDQKRCMYIPILIHNFEDYNICGSVYQDIDIPHFLRNHLNEIEKGVILSAPPCQIPLIKKILEPYDIKSFVISFCCSGQTSIEGTWKYYDLLGIERLTVKNMQYRGNGWPSGIQIELTDGRIVYRDNWTEPWSDLQKSKLYSPKRCCLCKLDASYISDITLADPWLDKYRELDTVGHTMYLINTEYGQKVIGEMIEEEVITAVSVNWEKYSLAQKENLDKCNNLRENRKQIELLLKLKENRFYFWGVTQNLFTIKCHIKLMNVLRRFFHVL
jgi:coenzyme F420-reducing hydrogenase beta subunit